MQTTVLGRVGDERRPWRWPERKTGDSIRELGVALETYVEEEQVSTSIWDQCSVFLSQQTTHGMLCLMIFVTTGESSGSALPGGDGGGGGKPELSAWNRWDKS